MPAAYPIIDKDEDAQEVLVAPRYVPQFKPLDLRRLPTVSPRGQQIERRSFFSTNTVINPEKKR